MAMNGDALGDAINAAFSGVDLTDTDALYRALGNAIVTYIQNEAELNISATVTQLTGVTLGGDTWDDPADGSSTVVATGTID